MSPRSRPPSGKDDERRHHLHLREAVEELLQHIRGTVNAARGMSDAELEYAQQRLEWLADEVWRACLAETGGEDVPAD